ncbi:uncharacterized protein LOC129957629 [Argiope bruennichi]|uniref:THAP-type domain-containing protein n=1 Tax=Argiope bruennichi TaxID=94029 RepID=A0A8T0FIY7_ARGBR|nr:uncharacterized protein LOC129957629 [Argiope bruennichi]KAF8789320.1 hypothetical protein HNY73_007261 [Argiope bruennichi]
MVFCCVPLCGVDSFKCDSSITFHEFPSNPDLAAKWIKQINSAVKTKQKPMWFPRGRSVICSKHFLQTDFKDESDSLKPRSIPTVFGHRYIGFNQNDDNQPVANRSKKPPLIVKVNRPSASGSDLVITNVFSQSNDFSNSHDELSKTVSSLSPHSKGTLNSHSEKNAYLDSLQNKNNFLNKDVSESGKDLPSTTIETAVDNDVVTKSSTAPGISMHKSDEVRKKKMIKKESSKNELIEIGPNTFLKINPDIIKVNKKQTPTGNTILQFIMDQKLANQASNLLPKIIKTTSSTEEANKPGNDNFEQLLTPVDKPSEIPEKNSNKSLEKNEIVVQQVIGHLVDTHVCQDTCKDLKDIDENDMMVVDNDNSTINANNTVSDSVNTTAAPNINVLLQSPSKLATEINDNTLAHKSVTHCLTKAPVLFTTNVPLSHCLTDKSKYAVQLKQKARQIASLKLKIGTLTKKIEELENRCIVQERQLSYSFIKRLKTIRKNAAKGDPCATYILEQIRCYTGKTKMRWSDSTLTQCAIWCRKAPYAYEYFKKADFFKLPCLGTVKRYMKKHPEIKFQKKINPLNPNESDSSSDFDFDDTDSDKEGKGNSDEENIEPAAGCEVILSESQIISGPDQSHIISSQIDVNSTQSIPTTIASMQEEIINPTDTEAEVNKNTEKSDGQVELNSFPMTVDGSNIEIQEIVLPSGEVVQCYASNLCNGTDVGNQYYIIPNVDQSSGMEQEYNVVQTTESLPVILQNLDNCQLPMQQEQYIFVTNSSEQVEGPETEVITASV